jgi:hypothetical protein
MARDLTHDGRTLLSSLTTNLPNLLRRCSPLSRYSLTQGLALSRSRGTL